MFTWWGFALILILIAFIISILTDIKTPNIFEDIFSSMVIVFLTLYGIILVMMWLITTDVESKNVIEYRNQQSILSLQDNFETQSNIHGSFVLGFGGVGGSSSTDCYYYTMTGNESSGYLLTKYSATNTYIFMDENTNPYSIDKVIVSVSNYKTNWFFGGLLKPLKQFKYDDSKVKELHVPNDTIKVQYNIDMK